MTNAAEGNERRLFNKGIIGALAAAALVPLRAFGGTRTRASETGLPDQNPDVMRAFPPGTILPWYAKSGAMPDGWAVCDGTNGTPDLRNRFMMGVASLADVGKTGGTSSHNHVVQKHRDRPDGNYPQGEGDRCYYTDTNTVDHTPPFVTVLFIMRVQG